MYIYIYTHIHTYILYVDYIYIYIYINIYIYIYIYWLIPHSLAPTSPSGDASLLPWEKINKKKNKEEK